MPHRTAASVKARQEQTYQVTQQAMQAVNEARSAIALLNRTMDRLDSSVYEGDTNDQHQ